MSDTSPTVLIVIDNVQERSSIARELEKTFKVQKILQTHTPSNGLKIVNAEKRVDYIFCDYELPGGGTGFDFITQTKNLDSSKNAVIIMSSARKEQEILLQAASIGVHDYIAKPYTVQALRTRLFKHFNNRGQRGAERVSLFQAIGLVVARGEAKLKGKLHDLSLGGCAARLQNPKKVAGIYDSVIIQIQSQPPIKMKAKLVRLEKDPDANPEKPGTVRAAFEFASLSPDTIKALTELIKKSKSPA